MGCLDEVVIAAPCPVSWDSMLGDERVRHCCGCAKNVFNIAEMTKNEAESFLVENGTTQCMRIFRRTDGTIMTDNCPRALRAIRNKLRLYMKVAAGIAASFFAFFPGGKGQAVYAQAAPASTDLRGDVYVPPAAETKGNAKLTGSKKLPENMEYSGKPMAPTRNFMESKGDSAYISPQPKAHKQIMLGAEGCQSTGTKSAAPASPVPDSHPRMGRAVLSPIVTPSSTVPPAQISDAPKKSDSKAYKLYIEAKAFEDQGKLLLAQAKYQEAVNAAKLQDQGDPNFVLFLNRALTDVHTKIRTGSN